jgi:hypothetical protein
LFLTLLAGLGVVLLAWAFIQLSSEMVEGDTRAFDTQLLWAAQSLWSGQPWVAEVMRDLSGLGSTAVLTLFTAVPVGYLALVSARATALLVATAVITGSVGVSWLKEGFGRLRPAADFAELVAPGLSFPSGHAGVSAIVFLTLAEGFDTDVPLIAYEVHLTPDGQSLQWVERSAAGEKVFDTEPETSAMRRLGVGVMSVLPIEWLL